MVSTPTANPQRTSDDYALNAAWRRHLDFSIASQKHKKFYLQLQRATIGIAVAVAIVILGLFYVYRGWVFNIIFYGYDSFSIFTPDDLYTELSPLFIVLALIALMGMISLLGLWAYNRQISERLIQWIAYRMGGELIRREIYLYRMRAGHYTNVSPQEEQQILMNSVGEAEKRVTAMGIPLPEKQMMTMGEGEYKQYRYWMVDSDEDNAFSPLSVDEYLNVRVLPQSRWYLGRSKRDTAILTRWLSLIPASLVLGIVALLSVLIVFEPLAAGFTLLMLVTAFAVQQYLNIGTYNFYATVYQPTAERIDTELTRWRVSLAPEEHHNPARIAEFVERIENLFQFERELWMLQWLFKMGRGNQRLVTEAMENGLSMVTEDPKKAILMPRNNIFISYRRVDSADITGRIYDRLRERYGREAIFKDVDSIPFGVDFSQYLRGVVSECAVLIAVIGPAWLEVKDEEGNRRLDSLGDFVRIEIATALQRNVRVVPVLVRDALMPEAAQLPDDLKSLALRNGLPVRNDPDFEGDVNRLIRSLEDQRVVPLVSATEPKGA